MARDKGQQHDEISSAMFGEVRHSNGETFSLSIDTSSGVHSAAKILSYTSRT